jgi:hypothetical protein
LASEGMAFVVIEQGKECNRSKRFGDFVDGL